jgi:hypothetical protein
LSCKPERSAQNRSHVVGQPPESKAVEYGSKEFFFGLRVVA